MTTTASVAMLDNVIHVTRQVRTNRETMVQHKCKLGEEAAGDDCATENYTLRHDLLPNDGVQLMDCPPVAHLGVDL